MNRLIVPKSYVEMKSGPLIFLAGPIKGAPKWHDEAIKYLFSKNKNLTIASPNVKVGDELKKYIISGYLEDFLRQRAWERHYLEFASKNGAIMFWLPGEEHHVFGKSYGAMTRLELGQWSTNYKNDESINICIGSDGNFSELKTIKFDLSLDTPNKKIFSSLEETCDEALNFIHKNGN